MVFKVQLLEDGQPVAGKTLKWLRTGDDQQSSKGEQASSQTEPLEIKTSLAQAGFVRIEVSVLEQDGSPIKNSYNAPLKFEGGAGVDPGTLQGYDEPADFDAFWSKQRDHLSEVPLKASCKEVTSQNPDFQLFDVQVDCAGGKPVSGYLSIPKEAKPKSLQAEVSFKGYGVSGANQKFRPGFISFNINAHGIENGREPEYYKALSAGELNHYAFNKAENANAETAYFNGMMLRVMRALEYVKSRPEWDGKRLIVSGGSQGGLQAITAAALDQDVTGCTATYPWCCDLGGVKLGRIRGWRPDYTDALGYYDAANMAKRIRCPVSLAAGLGDYTCPPSGVSVLYNNIKSSKNITFVQGATHLYFPPNPTKQSLSSKNSRVNTKQAD